MGRVRVYASDSMTADVDAKISGMARWYTLSKNYRRAATDEAYARYDLTYSKSRIPPVAHATGVLVFFDLAAVPELQAKAVRRITGPFMFLRKKYGEFYAGAGYPVSFRGYAFEDVFLNFLLAYPSDPGRENYLGKAAAGAYLNAHIDGDDPINIRYGVHHSEITACINAYPGVSNRYYQGRVQAVFDSATGENPPYILVEYEDSALQIANCSPQAGFVDEKAPVRLRWSLVPCSKNAVGAATQKSASVQWRRQGSGDIHSVAVESSANFCVLPAGTLPDAAVEWRVSAVAVNGVFAPWSDWYALTTADNRVAAPDALSPDGELLDGAKPIALSWRHNSPLGTGQTAFEAQIDLMTGAGWRDVSGLISSAESAYTIPKNSLPSGYLRWRVRDYNSDGVASPWSEPAHVTVRAAPRLPVFRVLDGSMARPQVSWYVAGQLAFQLEVLREGELLSDSGTVFSTQGAYRIPELLQNGGYTVRVRAQNEYGLWSEWAETALAVEAPKRWTLSLEGQELEAGALLTYHMEAK